MKTVDEDWNALNDRSGRNMEVQGDIFESGGREKRRRELRCLIAVSLRESVLEY
jgi:hypothetical protein